MIVPVSYAIPSNSAPPPDTTSTRQASYLPGVDIATTPTRNSMHRILPASIDVAPSSTSPHLPTEIYDYILRFLVDDSSLGDDFDERMDPFHGELPLYPVGRMTLATVCTRVCRLFYDLAMPLVWQYLKIDDPDHLPLLHRLLTYGTIRPFALILSCYTRRVDFNVWGSHDDADLAMRLLSGMQGLRVLTCDNEYHGMNYTRVWNRPSSYRFFASIATNCPQLRRLQFLSSAEVPSLLDLDLISQGCGDLRTLQLACMRESHDAISSDSEEGRVTGHLFFPALERLSVGTGSFCGNNLPSGALSARYLLNALRRKPTSISHLEYLDAHVPFSHFDPSMILFRDQLRVCVFHLYGSLYPPDMTDYSKLTRLIFVVHGYGHELPRGLFHVEELEFVTKSRVMGGREGRRYSARLRAIMCLQLERLEDTEAFSSLKRVVLWRRVPGNCVLVEGLVRGFARRLQNIDVVLEVKDFAR